MTKKTTSTALKADTILTHTGLNPKGFHGFVNPPVVHASTVLFPDSETMATGGQTYTYGRRGTPTTDALETAIKDLELADTVEIVQSRPLSIEGLHVLVSKDHPRADEMLAALGVLSDEEKSTLEAFRADRKFVSIQNNFVEVGTRNELVNMGSATLYDADTVTDCRSAYGNALADLAKLNKEIIVRDSAGEEITIL